MRLSLTLAKKKANSSINQKSKFDLSNALTDCLSKITLLSTLLSYSGHFMVFKYTSTLHINNPGVPSCYDIFHFLDPSGLFEQLVNYIIVSISFNSS